MRSFTCVLDPILLKTVSQLSSQKSWTPPSVLVQLPKHAAITPIIKKPKSGYHDKLLTHLHLQSSISVKNTVRMCCLLLTHLQQPIWAISIWLRDCSQHSRDNPSSNCPSSTAPLSHDVPQSSMLGALLFILYMSDFYVNGMFQTGVWSVSVLSGYSSFSPTITG